MTLLWSVAGLILAGLPGIRELRRMQRTAKARATAPGRMARLSRGWTHFDWFGPENGPVVVCVHGLTTPSFVWLGLAPRLAARGYRVLIYDLYGRGHSSAPYGLQTPGVFCRQLEDLLAHEDITQKVTLLGYSMGGTIATAFAAHSADRVSRLVLIAPAGMGHNLGRLARWNTEWPLLGDWAFHIRFPRRMAEGVNAERDLPGSVDGIGDLQMQELTRRGYLRSVLSSLRGTLRRPMERQHRALATAGLPVTAIWGRGDAIIPLRALGQLTQWNRSVDHVVVDDAGHGVLYTHTDAVLKAFERDA